MTERELLRRLDLQDWECAYCGDPIAKGEQLSLAYDNNGIVHFSCVPTFYTPEREASN